MAKQGLAASAMAALDLLSTKISQNISATNPTLTLTVTAVAGFVVAAALGGSILLSIRKQQKRHPLTAKQWGAAFVEFGRLINQNKILDRARFGGIEPHIRAEVWPFLLGFYGLDSTREERETEKHRKRELYMELNMRCNTLRAKIAEAMPESEEGNISTEMSYEESRSSEEPQPEDSNMEDPSETSEDIDDGFKKEADTNAASVSQSLLSGSNNVETKGDDEQTQSESKSVLSTKLRADIENDCLKVTDEFLNSQRIIRLDAVRMNAEWVPYSPSQANVTEEFAFELARSVGLKDYEHLEPCRQHHAARLVAILEAYALHDPETGYCQGMSDLLSPFVALFDEDHEAFWCFVQFMNIARFNFRSNEVGIRRQLNKISSIFKAGDPQLYAHLESIDAGNCFFVYRMVVVLLRRELTFEQTISLWEVLWAEKRALGLSIVRQKVRKRGLVVEDLLLFVIAAAVRQRRKVILEKCRGLDEVLRECNNMAGHLDIWKLLKDARDLAYAVRGKL